MNPSKKMVWSKLKHPFRIPGRCGKKCESNSLVKQLNVNEEYKEAFRTQSYIDICSKVEGHMQQQQQGRKSMDDKLSSSSSFPLFLHLSESLLEPGQETLADIIQAYNLHPLLVDYFKITTQACNLCAFFLQSIRQTRANYGIIKRVIKLSKRTRNFTNYTDDQCTAMFEHLASFALKNNPLSSISPFEFRQTQAARNDLLHQLTLQSRKITRRIKLRKCFKKIMGCTIVVAYTALAITLVVLAFHTTVGIVTAPAVLTCSIGFFKKPKKLRNKSRVSLKACSERVGAHLDLAAKGVYILINDFNTMSRLVRRLNDEIEHRIAMANMCVRNGKAEVLREVVREFRMEETCLLEQLEELEDHIYLCFLTINRSRRLLVEELMNGATINL